MNNQPVFFQRIEGAALFLAAAWAYGQTDYSWWFFALLLFVFDLSMLGYMIDKNAGAILYNIGHSLTAPLAVCIFGFWTENQIAVAVSLIWLAHIGMDRAFGYGLKFAKGFRYTHLGKIGSS